MELFFWGINITITIVGLILIYQKRGDEEKYLAWKLFGFCVLGCLAFRINNFPIPLGFIIYLVFFHPRVNRVTKRRAALLGLVIFILGSVFPSVEKYMLERPREIAVTSTNVYQLNFSEEWKKLQTKLNIVEDARLTRINIIFNADGKLKTVNGEFIGKEKNEFIIYDLDFDSNTNKYIIQKNKSTQDVANYRDLVTLTRFFHVVDQVGLKNMFPSTLNEDQYAVFAMGETNMGKQTEEMVCFIENDGTVKKVDYDTLPLGLPFMHVDNYFYYYYP